MIRISFGVSLGLCFLSSFSFSQNSSSAVPFCEVIEKDSVKMYFNNSLGYTYKDCADNIRYTRINGNGDFEGPFKDVDNEGHVLGKGQYKNGKRDGYFEAYYPSGKTKSSGTFHENSPSGLWKYFHENGVTERIIEFNNADTLLLQYTDEDGRQLVANGSGKFDGSVNGWMLSKDHALIAKGKIVDGKPDGKWSAYRVHRPMCQEEFDHGKFIKGHGVVGNATIPYKIKHATLNQFFFGDYYYDLEALTFHECYNSGTLNVALRKILRSDFEKELWRKQRKGNRAGDFLMIVQFYVNQSGTPEDFKLLTPSHEKYFLDVTRAIAENVTFSQMQQGTTYLYYKLNCDHAPLCTSQIKISQDPDFTFRK